MSGRLVGSLATVPLRHAGSARHEAAVAPGRSSPASPDRAGATSARAPASAVFVVVAVLLALGLVGLAAGPAVASTAMDTPSGSGQHPAASPLPTGLAAASWLVADADTGEILAAQGARTRDLPASTMKILTALVVLPALAPDLMITVGKDAAEVDGTKVGLVPGQNYSVRDLATAMMIASGNDATLALVDAAGGRDAVLAKMNALAAALGATDTVAVDPTGLDAPGQLTSVRDLAILGRAAIAQPAVSQYLTIPRASLPTRDGGRFEIQNHNLLLGTYEGTLGVKNGYTVAADATYVGAVRRGGRTLVVALLRTAPNYGTDARALLDWGFANDGLARPAGTLPAPAAVDVAAMGNAAAAGDAADAGGAQPAGAQGGAGRATDGTGRADQSGGQPAPGAPSGEAARAGGGIGWVTWAALSLTVLVSACTALGHRRRLARARRRPAPTRRGRRPPHGRGARHHQAHHRQGDHRQSHQSRHRPPPAQQTARPRQPSETTGGQVGRRHSEPGARP